MLSETNDDSRRRLSITALHWIVHQSRARMTGDRAFSVAALRLWNDSAPSTLLLMEN